MLEYAYKTCYRNFQNCWKNNHRSFSQEKTHRRRKLFPSGGPTKCLLSCHLIIILPAVFYYDKVEKGNYRIYEKGIQPQNLKQGSKYNAVLQGLK